MVGVFKRSLSFPNKNPNRPPKPPISHHIRSISLPCRSHPLISQLKDDVNDLKLLLSTPLARTSSWLCDSLTRLKCLYDTLEDILQLPQTQESLRRHPNLVEKLLEDFLRFVDAYGIFQTSVLSLKEEQFTARVAVRKRDESKIAMYISSRKKIAKEMEKLVCTMRDIAKFTSLPGSQSFSIVDADLVSVLGEVVQVTASVSVALFNGISASFASRRSLWTELRLRKKAKKAKVEEGIEEFQEVGAESLWGLRKKSDEQVKTLLKRMQELESSIVEIECGSEKVFRILINTRVSLLNSFTQ